MRQIDRFTYDGGSKRRRVAVVAIANPAAISPPMTDHPAPTYRPDIDGLRAVAVLSVVAFHAFPSWMKGGFIGVDIFFVISGFLISTIIFGALEAGNFSFSAFYTRRIRRIFPALSLVLIASYALGWIALLPDEYDQLGVHIAAGAGFISNFVLWGEAGYFDNSAETKPLLHLWSLGIEEQFYILWPALLWFASRRNFNLLKLTIILAVLSFALNLKGINQDSVGTFYSPITRFWELLCGSILAWLVITRRNLLDGSRGTLASRLSKRLHQFADDPEAKWLRNLVCISGCLLLTYGFFTITQSTFFPGWAAVIPVLGTMMVMIAGPHAWINRNVLSNKIVVWFGLISFPLYLWHWPILSFARIIESETPSRNIRLAAIAFAVLLAWLTYLLVERPIRSGGHARGKVAALVALMTITGYAGYDVHKNQGLPLRDALRDVSPPIERVVEDDPKLRELCLKSYGLADSTIRYCRLSESGAARPRIALIGDSHAAALFPGLSKVLDYQNEGLLMLGGRLFLGVAAYPDRDRFEIDVYKGGARASNFVADEASIDTVIMVSRGPFYINDGWNFYLIDDKKIADKSKVFEIGMRKTLNAMVGKNKKVIFVLDTPELNFDPNKCQNSRPLSTKRSFNCVISRAEFDQRHRDYRNLVFKILKDYPSVVVFDPSAYLCDELHCRFKEGASVLFGDMNHLSASGSDFMATRLVEVLNGSAPKILN